MKIKNILLIFISVLLVFSLAACSKGDDNREPVDIQPEENVEIPPEETIIEENTENTEEAEEAEEVEEVEEVEEELFANIGNIVRLKEDDVALLIISEYFKDEATNTEYEFVSVPYPIGLLSDNTYYAFNLEDVEEVLDLETIILREDLNFLTGNSLVAAKVSTQLSESKVEQIIRNSLKYTVYQKNVTESGISIGVENVTFKSGEKTDILIFDFIIENNSSDGIIANGRLDITLSDKANRFYECNDGLINAKDIINFRIPAGQTKTGKIAFEVQKGTAGDLRITYSSDYIPEMNWFLSETKYQES